MQFYNAGGAQILQGGKGYLMKYSGTKNDSGTNYDYYVIPIPTNAKKFRLIDSRDYCVDNHYGILI